MACRRQMFKRHWANIRKVTGCHDLFVKSGLGAKSCLLNTSTSPKELVRGQVRQIIYASQTPQQAKMVLIALNESISY